MATPLTGNKIMNALKAEGVKYDEYKAWWRHNRNHKGPWGPVNGIIIHHTAGANSLSLVYNGRSDLPGPLAHAHLSKDGTVSLTSTGRANHAGPVAKNAFGAVLDEDSVHPSPSKASGTVDGNQHFYGIEIENRGNGKDPYPSAQYDAAVRWAAALCRAHKWTAESVVGHKETSVEGKIDPSFDMKVFRSKVAERLKHPASWSPSAPKSPVDDKPKPLTVEQRLARLEQRVAKLEEEK